MLLLLLPVRLIAARLLLRALVARGQIICVFVVRGIAEELVEERERRRLAVLLVVLAILILLAGIQQALEAAHHVAHLAVQVFQIIVRKAHAADHIIHRLDAELLCTFQAEALVGGLSVLHFGDEDHG